MLTHTRVLKVAKDHNNKPQRGNKRLRALKILCRTQILPVFPKTRDFGGLAQRETGVSFDS